MSKHVFTLILAMVFTIVSQQNVKGCTNYLVTKSASTDGSTMISYAADSHTLYGELYHWPAKKWPAGAMMDIYEWDTGKSLGKIKQVTETYNVVGNMNEWQVSIGETTFGGRSELGKNEGSIMDYGSLIYTTLQRAKSAREAIRIMTDLVEEYGYYSSGESFSIADKNEVWIMEMIGKGEKGKDAVWVALLIPDGYVSGHANQARITTFDYQKKNRWDDPNATVFNAPEVISFAREMGYFNGKDKDFSFSDTYAPVDFGGARFCEIRVYSMFHKVSREVASNMSMWEYVKGNITHEGENGYASNRMPLWVKPDKKVSLHDMFMFMRDHLEGTELDMSKDMGAGPFGNPYRWRGLTWKVDGETYCNERATATQQTAFSFVSQMRSWLPDAIGGIHWWSVDDAASTVYAPMYCSMTKAPTKMATGYGSMMEFKADAAFWVFNQVSNFAYTRYDSIHYDIAKKQLELELAYIKEVQSIDKAAQALFNDNPDAAVKYLTDYSVRTGDQLVADWQMLYGFLFAKYVDGNIKYTREVPEGYKYYAPKCVQPGYGESWYRKIVEETGDQFKMPAAPAH
jgi:dipeptidase